MIAVIIMGHGRFGSSILESVEMIIGKQENVATIDFLENQSIDDIDNNINEKLKSLNKEEGILVLTDLLGGSPFNRAMLKSTEEPLMKVIAGVNMPLVIELLSLRDSKKPIDDLIKEVIKNSKESIVFGNEMFEQ